MATTCFVLATEKPKDTDNLVPIILAVNAAYILAQAAFRSVIGKQSRSEFEKLMYVANVVLYTMVASSHISLSFKDGTSVSLYVILKELLQRLNK
eukprot:CAMPEP_0204908960 /NCGR_PEP_ID=MMETSP1397-20131031/7803_1 /ASSEMBLY_ACC=CAM_ASM_000891 /TAXON_ID=49980 /ORGANISM="Climacostomum Climacostomum virens, Strain Stock W-24" /LENGTH=94 /DNA_ID=CAMNT_0052078665 /DNA_START=137 /DNA_END=421 /DNA_ORIENTATION=+